MSDRRERKDERSQDRRVVDRITIPRIRRDFELIRKMVSLLVGLVVPASALLIYQGVKDHEYRILNFFVLLSIFAFATILTQYRAKLNHYLETESKESLTNLVDKEISLWFFFCFASVLVFLGYCYQFFF